MAIISKEIKDYIDSVIKAAKLDSLTVGNRAQGSTVAADSYTSGINNAANAPHSAAIGSNNTIDYGANSAVALGEGTRAYSKYQLVHGKYNDSDSNNVYAHIVGGGEADAPKNIYTLDWEGNATFAGSIQTNKVPEGGNDLVNLDYLNNNMTIKYFPYEVDAQGGAVIYVNDLEPNTLYKAKIDNYKQIKFAVRCTAERPGSPAYTKTFFNSDASINKYNMYVSNKDENSMMLFINSLTYEIKFNEYTYATVDINKGVDNSFTGPGLDMTMPDIIKDNELDANKTWSSTKLDTLFDGKVNSIELRTEDFDATDNENKYTYHNYYLDFKNDKGSLGQIQLPSFENEEFLKRLGDEDYTRWNQVENKVNTPKVNGQPGQILGLDINGNTVWVDDQRGTGGGGGTGSNDANDIMYGSISVKDALDQLLYKPPTISLLDNQVAHTFEYGKSISNIVFTWTTTSSKPIMSQSIAGSSIPVGQNTFAYNGTISEDTTITLSVTDEKGNSARASIKYDFSLYRYYGASAEPAEYTESFIENLRSKELNDALAKPEFSVNVGANQYMYYCFPSKYGTPIFNVGGFDGGFEKVATVNVTNTYGHLEDYDIYKTNNHTLGTIKVSIRKEV